jgi:predicted TIM-barrel fold metal-dependent hydrolase
MTIGIAHGCDCHVHIVGPIAKYPQIAKRSYTAEPAPLRRLEEAAGPLGITRFVIVQPSFYGRDNSCMLAALDELRGRGRGVAVLDPATDIEALRPLQASGVRGVRVNLYSPSRAGERARIGDLLGPTLTLAASVDWHVEVVAPLPVLADGAALLAGAPADIVIDHYGLVGENGPESAAGIALLELMRQPHVWMKLSAPYRVTDDPRATRPPIAWLEALLDAAPDRCVWGSDWPHTPAHGDQKGDGSAVPYRVIPYAQMVADFARAIPDGHRRAMFVDNPQRLYGFLPQT